MAVHKITINSSDDWGKAAKEIRKIATLYSREMDAACKEVAQRGGQYAIAQYSANSGDGNDNVNVTVLKEEKSKYRVQASGSDLYFNEFGAGFATDWSHPYAGKVDVDIEPGSYSRTEGTGQFARDGFWWWNGKYYTGLQPSRALYHARKHMERIATDVVRRCFRK